MAGQREEKKEKEKEEKEEKKEEKKFLRAGGRAEQPNVVQKVLADLKRIGPVNISSIVHHFQIQAVIVKIPGNDNFAKSNLSDYKQRADKDYFTCQGCC